MKAEIAPHGTIEVRIQDDLAKAGKKTRALFQALRRQKGLGVIEVYGIIYDPTHPKPAIFDRQYNILGRVALEQAEALIADAVVISDQDGYTVGGAAGYTVWLAHPESSGARLAEPENVTGLANRPRP